jgi:transcriptional regulator with XRE-family HTH domain
LNGSTIVRLRTSRNMSQQRLATAAGLSITTIWRVENNKHPAKLETLAAIAGAFGIGVDTLLAEARKDAEQAEAAPNGEPAGKVATS